MSTWFWVNQANHLLWHAASKHDEDALCGKHVPPPRLARGSDDVPLEDERCARCDRMMRSEGLVQ